MNLFKWRVRMGGTFSTSICLVASQNAILDIGVGLGLGSSSSLLSSLSASMEGG